MIPIRSEDWEFKLAEQGLDLVKAPTEEEIEEGPIANQKSSSWVVEAEGMAGSNDQLYLDPMFTGAGDGNTGPAIQPTPLTDGGTSTETLEKKSSWMIYSTDMGGSGTPQPDMPPAPTTPPSVSNPASSSSMSSSDMGGSGVQHDTSTGQYESIAPTPGQVQQHTPNESQLSQSDPAPTTTTPTPKPKTPSKPSGGGGGWFNDIINTVENIATNPIVDTVATDAAIVALASIKQADGDENIPGSTQPSLGQNESTMERHVISPFTQPSKQTSDRGTTPQTNSPSNTNAISLDGGQKQNAMNPLVDAISPEGNENIIMNGSKSSDYLEMITKKSSDSEIYFKGFSDGKEGKEMDKSLSNLSDDYFNGWQDGKIYITNPTDWNVSHQPQKRTMAPINLGPDSDDEVHDTSLEGWDGIGGADYKYTVDRKNVIASIDTECNECGSIRVAHCGTCEGSSPDLKKVTKDVVNVEGPADDDDTQTMQVAGSVSCKNCYGSGIVCIDCGCGR